MRWQVSEWPRKRLRRRLCSGQPEVVLWLGRGPSRYLEEGSRVDDSVAASHSDLEVKLPGTLGLITGASALKQTLGGHSRPKAVRTTRRRGDGGGPRRRRRAAFSRFDLPQLLLLKSTCELARRRGWECSRAACASARGARSLSRGHGGSGEYLARSHYFTLYQALPLMPLQEPPAAVVEPVRGSSRDLLAPGSELAWRVASLSRSERGRVGACARALLQGEARRGAGRRGAARRAAAARGRSFCPGEAWLARRAVMTQHAEKSLVSHRGGGEPKQATCRMTG